MDKTIKTNTLILLSIIGALIGSVFAIIYINKMEQKELQNIEARFANQMDKCWKEVETTGQTCHLEYIYTDGHQTPVSARVIKK